VCWLVITSKAHLPVRIAPYPSQPFDARVVAVPPGTAGGQIIKPVIQGKIPENFAVSWPQALRVGVSDQVIVRIASNDYEDLLKQLSAYDREVFKDRWKGFPDLVVTLETDSTVDIIHRNTDEQKIEKGKPHREWSWGILPKATGTHELTVRVYGVHGNVKEDYDPEIRHYSVAFNPWYWFTNGVQQQGINWVWAIIFGGITFVAGRLTKRPEKPTQATPESPTRDP
jgi:hypothetical protein